MVPARCASLNHEACRNSMLTVCPAIISTQCATCSCPSRLHISQGENWKCNRPSLPASLSGSSASMKRRHSSARISGGVLR